MKKLLFLFVFLPALLQAQYKISGTLQPSEKYSWVLLYKVEGARQQFIKNASIKEGKFDLELPADAVPGSYRITYDMQNSGFVDFLFNKEDIIFSFNPEDPEATVQFQTSAENRKYQKFLNAISFAQYKTDSLQIAYLQNPAKEIEKAYKNSVINIRNIQDSFVKSSEGMLAYHFIKATDRYNAPEVEKTPNDYLKGILSHFFDNIDFENKVLYNSPFLVDRITDYVFHMNNSDDPETQEALYKRAIKTVMEKVKNPVFKKDIIEFLITQFFEGKQFAMVEFLLNDHFDTLPEDLQDSGFKERIEGELAVQVGRIAPDFSWKENGKEMQLSKLQGAKNYILIFWSTGCPHCVDEVPKVYDFIKDRSNVKVIAFALEKDDLVWKNFIPNLEGWHHVLGLNKWENETARMYQVFSTPTYIVLDADKKIVAKPEKLETLKELVTTFD